MISHKNFALAIAVVAIALSVGCQSSRSSAASKDPTDSSPSTTAVDTSAVTVVKNGILADHDSTTVGKAFDGTFQNAKWSSFETPKGEVVVEFEGTIKYKVLSDAHV